MDLIQDLNLMKGYRTPSLPAAEYIVKLATHLVWSSDGVSPVLLNHSLEAEAGIFDCTIQKQQSITQADGT